MGFSREMFKNVSWLQITAKHQDCRHNDIDFTKTAL